MSLGRALAASILAVGLAVTAASAQPSIAAADWEAYKSRFLDPAGRIVDDGNGGISHSEGQGYGLLLAYLAEDEAAFDLIWSFTRTEFMLRDDGLAVWKWDPAAEPHVTDVNNASDGDILIAHALALAGEAWEREELTASARAIAQALSDLVFERGGRTLLLPAKAGYGQDARPDGPVVNLSYWVFEAFPHLQQLAPETPWLELAEDGIVLLRQSLTGPLALPPEWLSVATRPRPAQGFPAEFGYNVLRVPLYLVRAGMGDEALLAGLADAMTQEDGSLAVFDLETGAARETLADAGYRVIPALVDCTLTGTALPQDLRSFEPTLYYPSTLHLLALSHLALQAPECLE